MNARAAPDWTRAVTRRLAGVTYVFGLEWRSPPGSDTLKAARAAVRETPGSLAAVRKDRWQFGIGPVSARGAVSAAAALADVGTGSWIGIWPLTEDGMWWGAAARHGSVYPVFGDALLARRDEARAWLADHAGTVEWDLVIAPEDLVPVDLIEAGRRGATTLEDRTLETLFARRRRAAVLADPVRRSTRRVFGIAAAAGLAVAFLLAASRGWHHWLSPPAAEKADLSPLPLPDLPAAAAVLDACATALRQFSPQAVPPGWQANTVACRRGAAEAVAEIAMKAHEWTPVALTAPFRPVDMDIGFESGSAHPEATLSRSAPITEPGRPARAAPATAAAALARLAETLGGRTGRELVTERRSPEFNPETHTPPSWSELHWTLRTTAPAAIWRRGVAGLPASTLTAITLTVATLEWEIAGWIPVDPAAAADEREPGQ